MLISREEFDSSEHIRVEEKFLDIEMIISYNCDGVSCKKYFMPNDIVTCDEDSALVFYCPRCTFLHRIKL